MQSWGKDSKWVYLLFGNQSSAIICNYVVEKIQYVEYEMGYNVRLIALISFRKFFFNRGQILNLFPGSIVVPHFPKLAFYQLNILILFPLWLFAGRRRVIAKNVFAASLARMLKRLGLIEIISYDAEGASFAERIEFGVNKSISPDCILSLEQSAIRDSVLVRTVSNQMPFYWKNVLGVEARRHVVIPCTLNSFYLNQFSSEDQRVKLRGKHGFLVSDILFVFAGSFSPWQGFDLMDQFFVKLLSTSSHFKVLLLSDVNANTLECIKYFPDRVLIMYVDSTAVPKYLSMCDYGMLLRHTSITNTVAAPTKFPEYLACGLEVLISPGIGDYSAFVDQHGCGIVLENIEDLQFSDFTCRTQDDRRKLHHLAMSHFSNAPYRIVFEEWLDAGEAKSKQLDS